MEPESGAPEAILGIDIGGTFTDLLLEVDGHRIAHKLLSTPGDFAAAVLQGAAEILAEARRAGLCEVGQRLRVRHGSTVATNAFLERKGSRVGLLVTAGFEDLLTIGRQDRPGLYDLDCERPRCVVAPTDALGIRERLDHEGRVLVPVDLDAAEERLDELVARGCQSVAISFLHSYANPEHERQVAARARARALVVSVSHEILPELREFERTATTAVNAYVAPLVSPYLARLGAGLRADLGAEDLLLFGSHGALVSLEVASRRPVDLLLSGPAGGVVGAHRDARDAGHARVLTYDMGGTSTDVCLCDHAPGMTHQGTLDGIPVHTPRLDIHTVGAGGGSIAWIDDGGALRVGPHSAGADPGPACYGRGGAMPTVSDANLVLGRLSAEHFLGGRMPLDPDRASAVLAPIAQRLSCTVAQTALDIVTIANVAMSRALRRISVERGHDLRDFTLVSFGGAGGLHAAELAADLGMTTVVVPPYPGVESARGMAGASLGAFDSRTVMKTLSPDATPAVAGELEAMYAELERRVAATLAGQGLPASRQMLRRVADCRYLGQSYELHVPVPADAGGEVSPPALRSAFHAQHRQRFGFDDPEAQVQLVTIRVRGGEHTPPPPPVRHDPAPATNRPQPVSTGRTWFACGEVQSAIHDRAALSPDHLVEGPALLVEAFATTLVPPQWAARVHPSGALVLETRP